MIRNFSIFLLATILLAASLAFAQGTVAVNGAERNLSPETVVITGRVVDAGGGNPVKGVTVNVSGTRRYDVTDAEGSFAIPAAVSDDIYFSRAGYKTAARAVTNGGNHHIGDIRLEERLTATDEPDEILADLPTMYEGCPAMPAEMRAAQGTTRRCGRYERRNASCQPRMANCELRKGNCQLRMANCELRGQ